MLIYFLFILGFVFLIKGADLMIEGASSIAKRFQISDLVIGLTIVAFGTSAPELVVNLFASAQGNTDLAISNVLGSNIANTFLAIGIAAIITPLTVKKNTVFKEIPLCLLAAVILALVANDSLIDGDLVSQISRIDGLVMIGFFVVFFIYTISMAKELKEAPDEKAQILSMPKSILFVIFGLAGLTMGGNWIVDGAIVIAKGFGMSEVLIGVTIVAVGTSLPEIVTSAVSAYRGRQDIAIGNAVGSNIFNIFWVLSASAILKPLPFDVRINFDVMVNILASALLFLFLFLGNKSHYLKRGHGIFFITLYVSYMVYAILQG